MVEMYSPPELGMLKISICEFCKSGDHRYCPGAVSSTRVERVRDEATGKIKRTKRTPYMIRCYCCGNHPRCRVCGQDDLEQVDAAWWKCKPEFQSECAQRVKTRLRASSLYRMIQECRVAGANARRRARMDRRRISSNLAFETEPDAWDEVMKMTDDELENALLWTSPESGGSGGKKRVSRPRQGQCECCGEPTKGGRFLPGHDAKLKKILRARWQGGDQTAYEELERRGWLTAKEREQVA